MPSIPATRRPCSWPPTAGCEPVSFRVAVRAGRPLRRTVTIAETLVDVGGHPYFGPPPKTRAGHRTIPLPRVAAERLAEHLAAYGRTPEDLVFTAPEGGPVWRRRFWAEVQAPDQVKGEWALRDSNPRPQPCESVLGAFADLGLPTKNPGQTAND